MVINEINNGVNSLEDKIKLGPGIVKSDVYFQRGSGYGHTDELHIRFHSKSNSIIIINQFFDNEGYIQQPQKIETLEFDNGSKINLTKPFRLNNGNLVKICI